MRLLLCWLGYHPRAGRMMRQPLQRAPRTQGVAGWQCGHCLRELKDVTRLKLGRARPAQAARAKVKAIKIVRRNGAA